MTETELLDLSAGALAQREKDIAHLQVLLEVQEEENAGLRDLIASLNNEVMRCHGVIDQMHEDEHGMLTANIDLFRRMCDANLRVAQLEFDLRGRA